MSDQIETLTFVWEGITIEVRFAPYWLGRTGPHQIAHLDITAIAPERHPLPITETGYRSHFLRREAVEEQGGAEAFVRAWLDHDAMSSRWAQALAEHRQLSLF